MGNIKDLTGQKFNMLTPVERIPNYNGTGRTYYNCLCDCGGYVFQSQNNLSSGKAYSCGCITRRGISSRKDYTGQRFGRLLVKHMRYNYKENQTYAECMCDCGTPTIAYMGNIKSGKTKSCGCLERESRHQRKHGIDISGNKYGRLTAICPTEARGANGAIIWECLCECGNITYAEKNNLERGHTKSCGCLKDDFLESQKLKVCSGDVFGNLTIIKEIFVPNQKRRLFLCKCACGQEIVVDLSSLSTGHTTSCGCLFFSKGEKYISSLLNEWDIKYVSQKRFPECKNKKTLPFDFYLEDYNLCIEYQGYQHYYPVKYWGGDERLKTYQTNDQIKNEYCINKDIRLIKLPYTMSDDEIRQTLFSILRPVEITA